MPDNNTCIPRLSLGRKLRGESAGTRKRTIQPIQAQRSTWMGSLFKCMFSIKTMSPPSQPIKHHPTLPGFSNGMVKCYRGDRALSLVLNLFPL